MADRIIEGGLSVCEAVSMGEDVAGFVRTLQGSAEVEWYRFVETTNNAGLPQPPLVVWRYTEPVEPAVLTKIGRSLETEDRLVKWYFDKPSRNWVLTPERVPELQRDRRLRTDTEAIKILTSEDPGFCALAVTDFNAILSELRRQS